MMHCFFLWQVFVFPLFIVNVIFDIWIELLEKAKSQIDVLKEKYKQLADILGGCPGQYYRYHGDWRSETQSVVSVLTFMHWLETGKLLEHKEAEEKLGCMP
jgi:hypothetical protein